MVRENADGVVGTNKVMDTYSNRRLERFSYKLRKKPSTGGDGGADEVRRLVGREAEEDLLGKFPRKRWR
jgi:hypothetical protein